MTQIPNWNPVSNTDEIKKLLLEQFEEENQPQTDVEQDVSDNTPKGTNNAKGNLDFLSYQATLAKAGQGVVYAQPQNDEEVYFMTTPLITTKQQDTDLTDPLSCLSIWEYGLDELDESELQVTKRSDGKITDIYYKGIRYGIRYDEQGNIIKTIKQGFDDQGRINSQQVDNWENGDIKQQTSYNYEYDEQGNRIQTSREAWNCSPEGNPNAILEKYFDIPPLHDHIFEITPNCVRLIKNVKKTQDGKITDFEWNGMRYSLRYDEQGNVTKAITQKFASSQQNIGEQPVVEQTIKEFGANGEVVKHTKYTYEYDDFTGERIGGTRTNLLTGETIDTKQEAIDNVKKMYATTVAEDLNREDEAERLNKFIENNTISELKNSGVSAQELEELMNELFPTLEGNNELAALQGGLAFDTITANFAEPLTLLRQLYNAYGEDAPFLNDIGAKACEFLANNRWSNIPMEQRKIQGKLNALGLPANLRNLVFKELITQPLVKQKV